MRLVSTKWLKNVRDAHKMLVFQAPLFVLISIAIKLDSPGPALFRQLRVRPDGRRCHQLRFRTMVGPSAPLEWRFDYKELRSLAGAEKWAATSIPEKSEVLPTWEHLRTAQRGTLAHAARSLVRTLRWQPSYPTDPRLTRVGRFLRQYSLDQLPMLVNVVRGEVAMPYPWRVELP